MGKITLVIGDLLEEKAGKNKKRTFLYFKDEQITYEEVNKKSNRAANGLLRLGIKKGDHVCIMVPNSPEFLYSWFGLAKIGAVTVPVNSLYKGEFLRYTIDHSDSKLIVMHSQFLERLKLVEDKLPKLEKVIVVDMKGPAQVNFPTVPFKELLEFPDETPKVQVGQYDVDMIVYTSGTTGAPKGVMRSHGYGCRCAIDHAEIRGLTPDDIMYTCLPLFHQNAQLLTALTALSADAAMALGESFSASRFWDEVRRYKATQVNLLGAMLHYLYSQPAKDNDADQPARMICTAPIPRHMYYDFKRRFTVNFIEGFGLTESGLVTYNLYNEPNPKLASFGKPAPGYEIKIVDDEDNEVAPLTVGEIVTRPTRPNFMMLGYYKMPEETLKAFRNLWFHTGDYGMMDHDGYGYFVDRKKDYLRVGGENISSMQVEATVNTHPKVAESAALGITLEEGAEDNMVLYVVLKAGEKLTAEELMDWCQENLPRFAVPRFVGFLDHLPKTPTERVEKYKLKERGIGPNTWDRVKAGYQIRR